MKKVHLRLLAIGLSAACVAVIIFFVGNSHRPKPHVESASTTKFSYRSCANIADKDHPFDCWYARYNDMVAKESPKAAIADLERLAPKDPYAERNCHQLTHVIGHAGYKKYNDLAKAFENGDEYCASGYYHGVMEEVSEQLGRDKVLSQINTICTAFEKKKNQGIEHHDCIHGMGHGLMAVNENDLYASLADCDLLESLWQQTSCYGGAFMENIVDEINTNLHVDNKFLRDDEPLYPCTEVDDKYKAECYTYQTSHMLFLFNGDYAAVFAQCASVADPLDTVCYQSLGRDISANTSLNKNDTVGLCMLGTTPLAQHHCITGAARDVLYITHSKQKGMDLCNAIKEADGKALCTKILSDYYKLF